MTRIIELFKKQAYSIRNFKINLGKISRNLISRNPLKIEYMEKIHVFETNLRKIVETVHTLFLSFTRTKVELKVKKQQDKLIKFADLIGTFKNELPEDRLKDDFAKDETLIAKDFEEARKFTSSDLFVTFIKDLENINNWFLKTRRRGAAAAAAALPAGYKLARRGAADAAAALGRSGAAAPAVARRAAADAAAALGRSGAAAPAGASWYADLGLSGAAAPAGASWYAKYPDEQQSTSKYPASWYAKYPDEQQSTSKYPDEQQSTSKYPDEQQSTLPSAVPLAHAIPIHHSEIRQSDHIAKAVPAADAKKALPVPVAEAAKKEADAARAKKETLPPGAAADDPINMWVGQKAAKAKVAALKELKQNAAAAAKKAAAGEGGRRLCGRCKGARHMDSNA